MAGVADMLAKNAMYTKPDASGFNTQLPLLDEMQYRNWVQQNNVPTQPDAQGTQDYDMRGFYRGLQQGDPRAQSAVDPNDSRLHFPDKWKTPGHETFSNESQWATPMAPQWTPDDKLVAPSGRVVFDDKRAQQPATLADTVFGGLR